jgi:sporulation protein YlmC with PRC-barrel domain
MRGSSVIDGAGEEVGTLQRTYLDDDTGGAEWVLVTSGTLRPRFSFVPLQGATIEGGTVVVAFSKDQVHGSPEKDADGHLSEDEEADLYRYYGLAYGPSRGGRRRLSPMGLAGDLPQG